MPMVGGKKFPYTPAGKKKAAQRARKIQGKPVPLPEGKPNRSERVGKPVPMPKREPNLVNRKPKMAPKKPGLKKQMGKYGKVGRA